MATKKLQQSQLELQAGQSGESAKQRSHESLVNSRQRNADRAEGARQFDTSIEQRNLDRYQRQWEQQRADRARRDAVRQQNQAQKPRTSNFGNEGYLQGQEPAPTGDPRLDEQRRQFDANQNLQRDRMAQDQAQFETSTDLKAASQGLMRDGSSPAAGADNPRLQALQMEMQQRAKEQFGADIEQTGRRGFVSTPEAQEQGARKAAMDERRLRAQELNAAANYQRAVTSYEKLGAEAAAAKTTAARKEVEAKQKAVEESLEQPIKADAGRLNRFMKGEQTEADVQTLKSMLKTVPPVGTARALHEEAASGEVGPAVTRFLGEKVAASAIQFIYATGKLPDGKLVDFSSAGMQEFSRRAMEARQLLMPDTVAGQMLTNEQVSKVKRGYTDHLQMVNKLAALLVMKQQPGMPSAALSPQQEPTHEQRRANPGQPVTPAERFGQITPDEAGRRAEAAGGVAAPRTSKQPYRDPGPYEGPYQRLPGHGSFSGYQ